MSLAGPYSPVVAPLQSQSQNRPVSCLSTTMSNLRRASFSVSTSTAASFSPFTDRDTETGSKQASSSSSADAQSFPSHSSSLYSITVMVLVAVLSTLVTLLFAQTVLALPLGTDYMRYLSKEVARLGHQNLRPDEFRSHADLLDHLEHDFYSTSGITHDVFVKGIHSHNDYWRRRPLLDALSLGVQSVEADIWHFPDNNGGSDVFVGHSRKALRKDQLLDSLYLDPLYAILAGANNRNSTDAVVPVAETAAAPAGVWDTDSGETLYFFIDFKTDGDVLFDILTKKFDRFRNENWLSWYNTSSSEFHWGPVTVIGTGNTPLGRVLGMGERRDIFFDGPLDKLTDADNQIYTLGVSPIASSSLEALMGSTSSFDGLSASQLDTARQQVARAHKLGIKTRIWDTPWWPVGRKYAVWNQVIQVNSDFLNADDLVDAVAFRN